MEQRRPTRILACFSAFALAVAAAVAQVPPSGQTAADNVRGGSVRGRNPGRMVQNGVARHQDFSDRQAAGTEITEPPTDPPFPGLVSELLDIVFTQINEAITAFRNLLLARAGQIPSPSNLGALIGSSAGSTENSTSGGGGRR